jgi:uncharacterized protein DUF882
VIGLVFKAVQMDRHSPALRHWGQRARRLAGSLCLACLLGATSFQASGPRPNAGTRPKTSSSARLPLEAANDKARAAGAGSAWRSYKKPAWRRGYVQLINLGNGRSWSGYVLGPNDTLLPSAERQIRSVLASWRSGRSFPIHPRLIRLIAQTSDVFGGRPMIVVSGYRERSHAKNSHHKRGEAFDFSIDGVPNWAVRDYLRGLANTGVGFYPRSTFVHLDVRKGQAYWVDMSRPGAPPRYVANFQTQKPGSAN